MIIRSVRACIFKISSHTGLFTDISPRDFKLNQIWCIICIAVISWSQAGDVRGVLLSSQCPYQEHLCKMKLNSHRINHSESVWSLTEVWCCNIRRTFTKKQFVLKECTQERIIFGIWEMLITEEVAKQSRWFNVFLRTRFNQWQLKLSDKVSC